MRGYCKIHNKKTIHRGGGGVRFFPSLLLKIKQLCKILYTLFSLIRSSSKLKLIVNQFSSCQIKKWKWLMEAVLEKYLYRYKGLNLLHLFNKHDLSINHILLNIWHTGLGGYYLYFIKIRMKSVYSLFRIYFISHKADTRRTDTIPKTFSFQSTSKQIYP